MACLRQMLTPPRALITRSKPAKSMTMKWSTGMPVSALNVLMVQAGPPIEKAELNLSSWTEDVPPPGRLHEGIVTQVSLGMLMTIAFFRLAVR